jgi:pimeloyl-ACP methyl ester carboxylesterase
MAMEALPVELARDLPEVPGVRHWLVRLDGVHLHVAEAGEGEPVVLQHGWPQHWYAWRHVIPELARTHRVIAPDLRGFGWSEAPEGAYDKETFATDLVALLDALELEQVDLIAHDWGGFAGFLACLHAPGRFRRFLALATTHPWIKTDPAGLVTRLPVIAYQAVLAAPLLGEAALVASPAVVEQLIALGSSRQIEPEAARSFATRLQQRPRGRATNHLYRTFLLRELVPILQGRYADRRLTVPTRLLVGADDRVITVEGLQGWEEHADDMEVVELDGVGHFIPDEAPDELLEHARALFAVPVPGNGAGAAAPTSIEDYLHPEREHVDEGLDEVAESVDDEAEQGAGAEVHVDEPWEGYDTMRVPEIRERLRDASPELAAVVRLYESTHKNRVGVMRAAGGA